VTDPFAVMNAIGLVGFAFVGAAKAIEERYDVFGVTVVGVMTALGGGTTRDLLLNRVPNSLQSPGEVALSLLGVAAAVLLVHFLDDGHQHPVVLTADAIGLAAFTTTGALLGHRAGLPVFAVVALATVNAAGGGAISDLLLGRTPFILRQDFYASCAVIGGLAFWALAQMGVALSAASAGCALAVLLARGLGIGRGWSLPTVQAWERRDAQ
jgi:uncharacterized membrane protein YeiH